MNRQDTYAVKVSVDGRDLGTWDKMSGGEVDSEETTYRPGGLQDQITLGGARSVGNVTVSKLYDQGIHSLFHWLVQRTGKANMVVIKQPLDAEGVVFGRPLVYSGKLKRVEAPEVDSGGNDAALIEIEMTCRGGVS